MINLGFAQVPYEALNTIAIMTALFMAARYIGFNIIATICGIISTIYGARILAHDYEIIISKYTLGTFEASLLIIVGLFLVYRGYDALTDRGNINTWK